MSKYLKRAFGGYKATDKLLVVDLEELHGKDVPKCDAILIELKRGDKVKRSDRIYTRDLRFPHKINHKIAMLSVFYVDNGKVQEKDVVMKIIGLANGKEG
jgi:hypothetical protein